MGHNLLVRLSAHPIIGMGHAVRTGALVHELMARGLFDGVTVLGEGDLWRPLFPEGADHIAMKDAVGIGQALVGLRFSMALNDFPFPKEGDWQALKDCANLTVAIDDWGGNIEADLIFNGTVLERFHLYEGTEASRIYRGADYTLLRPEFANVRWLGPDQTRLSVIIGSGEAAKDWAFDLLEHWPEDLNYVTQFVVGAGFSDFEALEALAHARHVTLKRGLGAQCLVNLLTHSRLALTTGGMIAYEVIALNVPALINPQIDNLVDEIGWFASHGACLDLGFEGARDIGSVLAKVHVLYEDAKALQILSNRQAALLDGQGLYRTCDEIERALKIGRE